MFLHMPLAGLGFLLAILTMLNIDSVTAEEAWTQRQWFSSQERLLRNVSPEDTRRGTVVASPNRENPNYYYHWTRDAALTMKTILHLLQMDPAKLSPHITRERLLGELKDFVHLSLFQGRSTEVLGEPKFEVDGLPYSGPWGRPQNDGPALRALVLMDLAKFLMETGTPGNEVFVRQFLYDSRWPTSSAIKRDLEYISQKWEDHDFDLWEEVKGHHFFTRMLQRKALLRGAEFASRMGDLGAANWYQTQALLIEAAVERHWSPKKGFIVSTLNHSGGIDYKSGLDSSIVLAVIHSHADLSDEDNFFGFADVRVMATVTKMAKEFGRIYFINSRVPALAPSIGRYPEDRYDGYSTNTSGNPWFLSTLMMTEYFYKLAGLWEKKGIIEVTPLNWEFFQYFLNMQDGRVGRIHRGTPLFLQILNGIKHQAEQYLERVHLHLGKDGNITEQFNRETGFMQGAQDLTWAHSSFIEALLIRQVVK